MAGVEAGSAYSLHQSSYIFNRIGRNLERLKVYPMAQPFANGRYRLSQISTTALDSQSASISQS
jgi:hypothetical protein